MSRYTWSPSLWACCEWITQGWAAEGAREGVVVMPGEPVGLWLPSIGSEGVPFS